METSQKDIEAIRQRVVAFAELQSETSPPTKRGFLAVMLACEAATRLQVAREKSDDERHLVAADELIALGEGVLALDDAHPLIARWNAWLDSHWWDAWPALEEAIRSVGFKTTYATAEDFLTALLEEFFPNAAD